MTDVLIVGAGQAGMQIAVSLRENGFDGHIELVGEEPHGPYQRPPLSKAFLHGTADIESLELRSPSFYVDNRIVVVPDETVVSVDMSGERGIATMNTGRQVHFDRLAITTGGRPRTLPVEGADLDGVLYLRDIADAVDLKGRWDKAKSVAVIGGGFIGLEVASVAQVDGKKVTVIEALDRILARAVSPETSEFYRAAHERRGTSVRLGAKISRLVGDGGKVTGVELEGGEVIPADIVMVGIGVIPRSELAEQLGLTVENGAIVVNEFAETSDPRVVAAGDVVLLPHPLGGDSPVRLESVQNAVDQAKTAAKTLAGTREPYHAVPWFWSDQADLKLQIAGLSTGFDQTVVRGNPDDESFSVLYYKGGRLIAIDSVNAVSDYMAVRKALGTGATIPPDKAADVETPLKTLVVD